MNLTVRFGAEVVELESTQACVVGRGSVADVRIDDPGVSRHHLDVVFDGQNWIAVDRSSAGSSVEGVHFERYTIAGPTTIRLGAANAPTIDVVPEAVPSAPPVPVIDVERDHSQVGTIALTDEALRLDLDDRHYAFVPRSRVLVGRDDDCDVVSVDRLVSGKHCAFEHDGSQWTVEDLDSTRGTFIDGQKVASKRPIAGAFHVNLGDKHAGAQLRVVTSGEHETRTDRRPVFLGAAGLTVGLVALAIVVFGGGGVTPDPQPLPAPIEVVVPESDDPFVPAEELAASIVQPVATLPDGSVCGTGSGTHVGDGFILTNFHVIGVSPFGSADCRFRGDIAIAEAPDQPAVVTAKASIMAVSASADLAVLHLDGNLGLPAIELATGQPAIGSRIRIFGFPGIGGETLTVTSGQVSGFLDDVNLGPGAWIKTDATVAGGNSGGAAIDDQGRLVGVPTIVGAGASTQTVECRPLADTNKDGIVDDADSCVSVGGFLNGVRPVSHALDLLAAASTAEPIAFDDPVLDLNVVDENADFDQFRVDGLRIDGFTAQGDDSGPELPEILCSTYEYDGIDDGISFLTGWVRDEVPLNDAFANGFWGGGTSGQTTSCYRPLGGITPGLYQFVILFGLENEVAFENSKDIR